MRNIKILIEYDGTNFFGWQIQREGRCVQGIIQDCLCKLCQEKIILIGAGRTDSGVHARGQVANFKTNSDRDLKTILRALNDLTPEDIVIHEISEVPLDFNSRYNAIERTYKYYISLKRLAIGKKYFWYCYYKLDFDLLNECSEYIKTQENFKSFCYASSVVKHHNCIIYKSEWHREGDILIFEITANRFLHNMVRSLVGTMIDVGRGYLSLEKFKIAFDKRDRKFATKAAPPQGLVLEKVKYPD
jgi:tRNA pseudouridine38-40 synthase